MGPETTTTLHTGGRMPILGLGTWQLINDTQGTVKAAINLGYRMIDTSGDYGTQSGIGVGMRDSGIDRHELYIVTKVEEDEKDSYEAVKRNLEELATPYVDLVLIHRPPAFGAGQELWKGLVDARKDGLARDIGVSNYSTKLLETLADSTGEMPAVNQIEWSPFGYSDGMLRFANEHAIVLQAYSPLTHGKRLDDETLVRIAGTYNKTPAQLLIRWNLQVGTVPLAKANQKKHLEEDINVFDFEISEEDMQALNELNVRYSSLGSLPYF